MRGGNELSAPDRGPLQLTSVGCDATKCGNKAAKFCLATYKTHLPRVHARCETRRLIHYPYSAAACRVNEKVALRIHRHCHVDRQRRRGWRPTSVAVGLGRPG